MRYVKMIYRLDLKYILHHGRRVGDEEKTEVRVVSGETNLIPHIETYQL